MPWGPLIGAFHGMALWVAHGDPPMGIPWHGIGTAHGGGAWNGSMGRSWGIHPWCSMSSSWGYHHTAIPWNALGTSYGDSMEWIYG